MITVRQFPTLLLATCAIVAALLLGACKEKAERAAQKEKFLTEFNPQLKLVREQLLSEITTIDTNITALKKLRSGFSEKDSKQFVTEKIDHANAQRQKLKEQLGRLEVEVEKGIALRELNKLDGGGKVSEGTDQLLADANKSLKESREVTDLIESQMGNSKGANRLPSDHAKPVHEERKAIRSKPQQTVESITQQAYTGSPIKLRVTRVKPGDFLAVREAPDLSSRMLSKIPANASGIRQRGAPVENAGTWLPVEFGGVSGFVNAYYVQAAQGADRTPAAGRSEAENVEIATQRFPELRVKDSAMNQEFVSRHNRYRNERPEYFDSADWPITLAEEVKRAITPGNGL